MKPHYLRQILTAFTLFFITGLSFVFSEKYEPDISIINKFSNWKDDKSNSFYEWSKTIREENNRIAFKTGQTKYISDFDISPDGNYIVIAPDLNLWEVETGRLIRKMARDEDNFSSVAFSHDGRLILAAGSDNKAIIWNTANGLIEKQLSTDLFHVDHVRFSNDDKKIYLGSASGIIKIYHLESKKIILTTDNDKNSGITKTAYSPDGKTAVSGNSKGIHSIWDLNSGKPITKIEGIPYGAPLAYSPDGKYLLSGSNNASSTNTDKGALWSVQSGELIHNFNETGITAVAISPDGRYGLTNSENGAILWDLYTGEKKSNLKKIPYSNKISFSADGKFIITVWGSSIVFLTSDTGRIVRVIGRRSEYLTSSAISSDNRYFVTGTTDGTISLFNVSNCSLIWEIKGHQKTVTNLYFSQDCNSIISSSYDGTIKLWKTSSGEPEMFFKEDKNHFTAAIITQDGTQFISGSRDKKIKIWNRKTGELIKTLDEGEYIQSLAISPDGKMLLCGSDGIVSIWNLKTNKRIQYIRVHGSDSNVAVSPDGKYGVSGGYAGTRILRGNTEPTIYPALVIFDLSTGKVIHKIEPHKNPTGSVYDRHITFLPDGKHFITVGANSVIKIWDVTTGQLVDSHENFNSRISALSVFPDGNKILIAQNNGVQSIYNLSKKETNSSFVRGKEKSQLIWTHEGYFSGNEALAKENVYIINGLTTYSIDQFFDTYYRPDIVQTKLIGKNISSLLRNKSIEHTSVLLPDVYLESGSNNNFQRITDNTVNYNIKNGQIELRVNALDIGGGAEDIRLYHNGTRVTGNSRGLSVIKDSAQRDRIIETFTIKLVDGNNTFRALAFSSNRIESKNIEFSLYYKAPTRVDTTLWVLSIGINKYKNPKYNLNYAVSDAESFVHAVQKSGSKLFNKVEKNILINENATRQKIIQAIQDIQKESKPEDLFIFFYAGHGIALEQSSSGLSEFFFIPTNITQMTDKQQVESVGISGPDFEGLVSSIPARKQFLVLDACNSGAINEAFGVRGAAEEIALSRLSRATGSALIAASRENQNAQEFKTLGQGALTKAILDGLGGKAQQTNGQITVGSLKSYVESALPELTEQYAGSVQYPTGFIFGQDFPIGIK